MELVARHERPRRDVAVGHRRAGGDAGDLDVVSEVLGTVRRAKTEAKQSQRASVATLTVTVPAASRPALEAARADLVEALTVVELELVDGAELRHRDPPRLTHRARSGDRRR